MSNAYFKVLWRILEISHTYRRARTPLFELLEEIHVNLKTGAWVSSLIAIASLIALVLIDGPLRWVTFGSALICAATGVALVCAIAFGWDTEETAH